MTSEIDMIKISHLLKYFLFILTDSLYLRVLNLKEQADVHNTCSPQTTLPDPSHSEHPSCCESSSPGVPRRKANYLHSQFYCLCSLCWGAHSLCIKLRLCRLWPAEWRGTNHPHRLTGSSFSICAHNLGKWNPGVVLTEGTVSVHSHKGSRKTLLTVPRNRGQQGHAQWTREKSVLCPTSQTSKT